MTLKFSDLRAARRSARRQASLKRVLSRDAFGGPLDQAVRWHLYYDGERVISAVAQGKGTTTIWSEGPAIEVGELGQADRLQVRIKELSQSLKQPMRNQTSLGLILHLADEVDVGIVQEEFENPELFERAHTQIRETPSEVVTDLSTEDPATQWRYYPLLSGHRAIVLRHRTEFYSALQTLTELDIKIAVHSAPIEMFAMYLKAYAEAIEEKPHCFVFFYDRFSVVIPINQGVLDLKVLPHRQQDVPPAFGDDLFSLLERFGMVDSCVLLLVPCGTREPTRLFRELDTYTRRNQKNAQGIEIQIPDQEAVWGGFAAFAPGQIASEIVRRPEFLTEYHEGVGKEFPLSLGIKSDLQRFGVLSRETFWPDDQKSRDQRLPRSSAIAMTALRAGRMLGVLVLLGLGAWLALSVIAASHGDALSLTPETINAQRIQLKQLQEKKLYLSLWDKILTQRSQAWSVMDFFLALLPEGNDVLSDKLQYAVRQTDLKSAGAPDKGSGGFLREWSIEGSCSDQGLAHLEQLRENSTIAKIFASTATRLNDLSFALSDDRIAKVVLRDETNQQFNSANSTGVLPYQFRLVVTQTFQGSDPLAIPLLPKPANKRAQ